MIIKILGSGCPNCKMLEANTRKALEVKGLQADVLKVTDYADISTYGIMRTPGLVIDEKVMSAGRVLSPQEISRILEGLQ